MPKKVFSDVYNVSGPHSYQQVAGDAIFQNKFLNLLKGRKITAVCSQIPDLLTEQGRADAQGVGLPRGIDVREDHMVRMGKGAGEIVEESFRAAVGMRLEDAPESPVRVIGRGLQGRLDLRGIPSLGVNTRNL